MATETTIPSAAVGAAGPSAATLAIRWVAPSTEGNLTRIGAGVTLIGRDAECDASLPSSEVSRKHAEIRWVGPIAMARDLDSRNGLFLNRRRITRAPLRAGDVLRLGDWVGVVVALAPGAATEWAFQLVSPGYWAGPALLARLAPARLVARSDLPIVIQGETGAGKEGAARSIHLWSGRPGPFVALNCAALPEALVEGELFGYRRGAFTGAERAHEGLLRAARGGTLFLDEVVDLSLPVQAKLLRAVEQREVVPLGESKPIEIDVRLLAATQAPLREAVEQKRFRGDLLARLQGFVLEIPPLRERGEEIPSLFRALMAQHATAAAGRSDWRPDALFVEGLCSYRWPFNVRELALMARRLIAIHPESALLNQALLHALLPESVAEERAAAEPGTGTTGAIVRALEAGAAQDRESGRESGRESDPPEDRPDPDPAAVLAALRAHRGNVKKTAAALGLSRGRMYRLMEKIDSLNLESLRRDGDDAGAVPAGPKGTGDVSERTPRRQS